MIICHQDPTIRYFFVLTVFPVFPAKPNPYKHLSSYYYYYYYYYYYHHHYYHHYYVAF